MNIKSILHSIALTIKKPTDKMARRADCHFVTAQYIKKHLDAAHEYIVLLGSKSNDVYHSLIVDDSGKIKSDLFKGASVNSNGTVSYPNPKNAQEHMTAKIIKTLSIERFTDTYINTGLTLKEFINLDY